MHGQGNYAAQVGQGPYTPTPPFQQRSTPPPPPPPRYGPPPPQPQVIQQGHPSFQPTLGAFAYQHAPPPSVRHQGPPAGTSSTQPYVSHPHPPKVHVSNPISHSYPSSEQQRPLWSQNMHQLPPIAPCPDRSAYPRPSSQGNTQEKRRFDQPPPHALPVLPPPPPPPPSYSSSSDPFGSSALSMRHHSYPQQVGPLPPPPPPPPPPPSSSCPEVLPFPPSLPLSDILSKNDGNLSSKGLPDAVNLMLKHPSPVKLVEDRCIPQIEVSSQLSEENGPKAASVDALIALSPADSDMDMEG